MITATVYFFKKHDVAKFEVTGEDVPEIEKKCIHIRAFIEAYYYTFWTPSECKASR